MVSNSLSEYPLKWMIRFIRFEPAAGTKSPIRKTAYDDFEPDGTFELFTHRPGDGVFHGDYVVTFTVFQDHMGRKSAIPAKYMTARESPFRVTVDGDLFDQVFELEKR